MKVKELIKILEACDPEAGVQCCWQSNGEVGHDYRKACCRLLLKELYTKEQKENKTAPLESFSVIGAQIEDGYTQSLEGLLPVLVLDQDYYTDRQVYEEIENMHK